MRNFNVADLRDGGYMYYFFPLLHVHLELYARCMYMLTPPFQRESLTVALCRESEALHPLLTAVLVLAILNAVLKTMVL